jgi:hypothetical protein
LHHSICYSCACEISPLISKWPLHHTFRIITWPARATGARRRRGTRLATSPRTMAGPRAARLRLIARPWAAARRATARFGTASIAGSAPPPKATSAPPRRRIKLAVSSLAAARHAPPPAGARWLEGVFCFFIDFFLHGPFVFLVLAIAKTRVPSRIQRCRLERQSPYSPAIAFPSTTSKSSNHQIIKANHRHIIKSFCKRGAQGPPIYFSQEIRADPAAPAYNPTATPPPRSARSVPSLSSLNLAGEPGLAWQRCAETLETQRGEGGNGCQTN